MLDAFGTIDWRRVEKELIVARTCVTDIFCINAKDTVVEDNLLP